MLSWDVDGFQGELMMASLSLVRLLRPPFFRSTSRFLAPSYFAVACSTDGWGG